MSEDHASPPPDDLHLALAIRRVRRNAMGPKRYQDDLPEASASLPPTSLEQASNSSVVVSSVETNDLPFINHRKVLKSPRNIFGLFRQYFATEFPSHDPEAELTPHDFSDMAEDRNIPELLPTLNATSTMEAYGPYPNGSSFALGEWFWNTSVQKSKEDFRHLVNIITDPAFRTEDVRETQWDKINRELGDSSSELDWVDEPDAGWVRTPVTIRVPFAYKINKRDRNRPDPVKPQDFVIEEFYHRSIVDILKERLSSPDAQHFHMEPYELHWQPGGSPGPIRVQGELYTSPAFINAHNTLQESPPEKGCDLPRVVAALMFASDATQLTSFGQASVRGPPVSAEFHRRLTAFAPRGTTARYRTVPFDEPRDLRNPSAPRARLTVDSSVSLRPFDTSEALRHPRCSFDIFDAPSLTAALPRRLRSFAILRTHLARYSARL